MANKKYKKTLRNSKGFIVNTKHKSTLKQLRDGQQTRKFVDKYQKNASWAPKSTNSMHTEMNYPGL